MPVEFARPVMGAGDLRDKVGFYKRVTASDGYGNNEGEFGVSAEFEAPALIRPRLGGEAVLAARLTGQGLANITVRTCTDTLLVTTDWRVKNERTGEVYNVRSIIDPDQGTPRHGRFLEMLCERGVST